MPKSHTFLEFINAVVISEENVRYKLFKLRATYPALNKYSHDISVDLHMRIK